MPQRVLIECKLNLAVKPLFLTVKNGALVVQHTSQTFIVYRNSDPPGPYHRPNAGHVLLGDPASGALLAWGSDKGKPFSMWKDTPAGVPITISFRLDHLGDGFDAFNNDDGSLVMDVAGENTAPGTQVFAWPWNGGSNQRWRFAYLE